jgi:hypothetical protein
MNLLDLLGMFIGSVALSGWRANSPSRLPQGIPPLDYTLMTQDELLVQFSDRVGSKAITPRSMRNLVASTVSITAGNLPVAPIPLPGWTTENRPPPETMVGPAIGYNYDLCQLDMWDDRLQTWVNPSFQGGTVAGATVFAGPVLFENAVDLDGPTVLSGPIFTDNLPTGRQSKDQVWKNGTMLGVSP